MKDTVDGINEAAWDRAMSRDEETKMCLAEEWVRDGRGLWAMRACQYYAKHGKSHSFGSWRYNVQPPKG